MNRIFQLILGIVIANYLVGFLMLLVYFPSHFKNFAKTYDKPGGVLNFETLQSLGDLQMSRLFYYDSAQRKNIRAISSERYVQLLWFSLANLTILINLLRYISFVLLRFAAGTGRKEFFNHENRQRLRIFWTFLLAASLFDYLVPRYQAWFLEQITDTYLGNDLRLTSYDDIGFPKALVSGAADVHHRRSIQQGPAITN
jgi:hypothetical protein